MAESIVSIAVETLWALLKEEAKLLSGVSDRINEVCIEFRRMQCFLQDAEARQHKEQTVQNWIREIRSLAYRAEDVIETYAVEVSSRRGRGFKKACKRFACILAEGRALRQIGAEIGNIKAEIAGVASSMQTYGIKAVSQGESSGNAATHEKERWLQMTYAHQVEETFVGMNDDIEKLKYLIVDEDTHHRVVSIWGMGGSGKTTVARKIYNHAGIRRQFDAFAWVCITQQCQVRKVLEEILQQLYSDPEKKKNVNAMADGELMQELYKEQKEKKCLVVLDDIWNTIDWNCLRPAFPLIKESPSKILLTTRNLEVAQVGRVHELSFLNSNEAWELLQKKALIFDDVNPQDSRTEVEREKIGREMVHKCGYLPLAISVIGGILSKNASLDEWRVVNKDIDSYLGREGSDGNRGIMQILTLSYDVLPYHLKQCFLSFGHFPEDLRISTPALYFTWLAEGIILPNKQSGREETVMVVADQYLTELASRSMVNVELHKLATPELLKYSYSRLHDLMRELCLMKCSEEDYVKVVDFQGGRQPVLERFPDIMDNITTANTYRLAIYTDGNFKGDAIGKITERFSPRLRSITFTNMSQGENCSVDMARTSSEIFNRFKYLRILSFDWYTFVNKKSLEFVGKLIHLRSIRFNNCKMDELPLQVLNLPFLQTLNLQGSVWKNPTKMPKLDVVWKAKRLRHLLFPGNSAKMVDQGKFRLCGLVQLEAIIGFDTDTMEGADLLELRNIQQFTSTIYGNESLSLILNCIEVNWSNIGYVILAIGNCNFTENESGTNSNLVRKVFNCRHLIGLLIEGSLGNKLPSYETNLASSLRHLKLSGSEIVEDPMEILEKLPNLRKLKLLMNSFMGKEMVCHSMGFPSLTDLSLDGLHNLEKWRIDEGAMPKLMKLEIRNCKKLHMIPTGLRFISTLKELRTADMPAEFIERIQTVDGQAGVDYDIVSHVENINLG